MMQTSRLSGSSFKDNKDADNSQKMAQSKDFGSLLVSSSTGMVSSPLHGLNASFQACNSSSTGKFGENGHATTGYASSWKDDFCVDHCYATKDTNVLLPKEMPGRTAADRVDRFSVKQKVAFLCAVAVTLCLLISYVLLHLQMKEQNQLVQAVVKDYQLLRDNFDTLSDDQHKLRTDYHALRDDHRKLRTDYYFLRHDLQKLRTEFGQNQTLHNVSKDSVLKDYHSLRENYDSLRNDYQDLYTEYNDYTPQKMTVNDAEESKSFSGNNDQPQTSSGALLQILQSNGLSPTIPPAVPRRTKRHAHGLHRREIEGIVENYLRRMPKVHLRGLDNVNHGSEYTGPNNRTLLWKQADSFVPRGVRLKYLYQWSERIKAIEIIEPGYYMVYSQVIVNGSTNTTWRNDCAHQTVEVPYHDNRDHYNVRTRYTVLLSGSVTQDSEGFYPDDNIPYPKDSSMHVGIFRLERQSQIRVIIPEDEACRLTIFSTDLHGSYFGLYKIG